MNGMHAHTGGVLSGLPYLHQSIQDVLTTPIGSRVMRHEYGSRLFELIDQPITPELTVALYAATAESIARWEPRFCLRQIIGVAQTPGKLMLSLVGTVVAKKPSQSSQAKVTFAVEVTR